MGRLLLLALALLLAPLEAASAPTTVSGRLVTHGFPLRSPSSLPACTAADSCVFDCYATSSSWECRKPDGTAVAVTQGVGTTFVQTPWGYAAKITTDAMAPSIDAATIEATLPGGSAAFYGGNYSIFGLGAPEVFNATPDNWSLWSHAVGSTGGNVSYGDPTTAYCIHYINGGQLNSLVSMTPGRWMPQSCAVTSAGSQSLRISGSSNAAANATNPLTASVGFYFGRTTPAMGAGDLDGYLARVRVYSRTLSAAEQATLEAQAVGAVGSAGRELTTSRASTAWMEHADGSVHAYGPNLPRIRSDYGLLIEGTRTNLLTYSTDFSQAAWTKAGLTGPMTPVVTANQATAPDGTLTADQIDFKATSAEGDYSIVAQGSAAAATYAGSVYVRTVSGSGTLYLTIARSGSATDIKSTACAVTTTWSRCYVEGAVVTASGAIKIGPNSYDAAQPNAQPALSVYVWGAQLEAGFGATSVIPTGAAAVTRANENITGIVTGWPRYDATICATLRWERDTRDRSASYLGNMLFDTLGAGSTQPGVQFWAWYEGGVGAFVDTATRTYTPSFPFDSRLCARRTYDKKFAVVAGSSASSTAATYLQAGHTSLRLGSYTGTSLPLNGYIRDFTVTP